MKKQKLRNIEYYNMQTVFDDLYDKSKNKSNYKFTKLMEIITHPQNIELAYRNIKRNAGSKTKGTNGHTITNIEVKSTEEVVKYIQRRLVNYTPHSVRRVEIPKQNGKMRPLGIPTIEDRIVQQCIKQVLEPICEGKFHNHSYGFRPNRSAHHAIGRSMFLANKAKLHYVVDIDIKGFFDNVNHGKLLKQMWNLGIRDKTLLKIISKMLKAPIEGIGVPTKGTPQGGILSPLLSNIVLNELDWWISDQWETFETRHDYGRQREGYIDQSNKYIALKRSNLKEIYIVRYADDFKLFCRNYKSAKKCYHATKNWLKERLHLDISEEKSKIVNLKNNYSEFLGFKMKLMEKNNKKVIKSHMTDKAKRNVQNKLKEQIKLVQKEQTPESANRLNSIILGVHNYYKMATHVNLDFDNIAFNTSKNLYNRLKDIITLQGNKSECYKKFYGEYNCKTYFVKGVAIFPIHGIKTETTMNFSQDICNYTEEGRRKIHEKQRAVNPKILNYIMENPIKGESIEYNDNRISLYIGQYGKCKVTQLPLLIDSMECHHKVPRHKGGDDRYSNLIFITKEVHKLIHATNNDTIEYYKKKLGVKETDINKVLKRVNKLRKLAGNFVI